MLSEIMCRRIFQQQQQQRQQDEKEKEAGARRKAGWSKSCCSGGPRRAGWPRVRRPPRQRPRRPPPALRPVNVEGNRTSGMRAPQNTNQFLMQEKYQMQHLRSDSVGSDSGCSSDSDPELTDMDSYLGVLENARGGLLDGPGPLLVLERDGPCVFLQEDSLQYVPSEDDLLQSQNFMQRDFLQFCDFLSP